MVVELSIVNNTYLQSPSTLSHICQMLYSEAVTYSSPVPDVDNSLKPLVSNSEWHPIRAFNAIIVTFKRVCRWHDKLQNKWLQCKILRCHQSCQVVHFNETETGIISRSSPPIAIRWLEFFIWQLWISHCIVCFRSRYNFSLINDFH